MRNDKCSTSYGGNTHLGAAVRDTEACHDLVKNQQCAVLGAQVPYALKKLLLDKKCFNRVKCCQANRDGLDIRLYDSNVGGGIYPLYEKNTK